MRRTIPKMVSDFEGAMFASRSGTEGICEVAGECGRPGGANTYNGPTVVCYETSSPANETILTRHTPRLDTPLPPCLCCRASPPSWRSP